MKNKSGLLIILAFTIIVAGLLVLFTQSLHTRDKNEETTAYVRVQNCILGIPPKDRSQAHIDNCYKVVEEEFQISLKRYDKL
jgi:hypothetical protein